MSLGIAPVISSLLEGLPGSARRTRRQLRKTGRLKIGRHTYGNLDIRTFAEDSLASLTIGKFCSVSNDVTVLLGGKHDWTRVSTFPWEELGWIRSEDPNRFSRIDGHGSLGSENDVVLGNDVWVGHGVLIMPGVTIGSGAVVGARSLVKDDIPPYGIAVGAPAKVIRYRFDREVIDRLLEIAWWDWSDERISEMLPLLCADPLELIRWHSQHQTR